MRLELAATANELVNATEKQLKLTEERDEARRAAKLQEENYNMLKQKLISSMKDSYALSKFTSTYAKEIIESAVKNESISFSQFKSLSQKRQLLVEAVDTRIHSIILRVLLFLKVLSFLKYPYSILSRINLKQKSTLNRELFMESFIMNQVARNAYLQFLKETNDQKEIQLVLEAKKDPNDIGMFKLFQCFNVSSQVRQSFHFQFSLLPFF